MRWNRYHNQRERILQKLREKRAAIVAAGGAVLEELRRKERERRAAYRAKYPDRVRKQERDQMAKHGTPFRTHLCSKARLRGRKSGLEATITAADLEWPTHCPVLGIELDYPARSGMRKNRAVQANWPSLDRLDNTKGYVPGNVFVISFRANTLKNSATHEEIMKIGNYLGGALRSATTER